MNAFILNLLFEILNLEFVHELVVLWMITLRYYCFMFFKFFKQLLLHFSYDWLLWSRILKRKHIFTLMESWIFMHILITIKRLMQTLHQIYLNFLFVKWISAFWLFNDITLLDLFNTDVRQFLRINFLAILFVYLF